MCKIIILQTGLGGAGFCAAVLQRMQLRRGKDFITFDRTSPVLEDSILTDSPQLLITSTFGGEEVPAVEMVKEFRKKNPQLVVVLFTSKCGADPIFDGYINKMEDDPLAKLVSTVTDFIEGRLRRKGDSPPA